MTLLMTSLRFLIFFYCNSSLYVFDLLLALLGSVKSVSRLKNQWFFVTPFLWVILSRFCYLYLLGLNYFYEKLTLKLPHFSDRLTIPVFFEGHRAYLLTFSFTLTEFSMASESTKK